ncbi:MAG: 3-oxoacyl-[acyl-carrier-protein] reductase [Thermodesulfobacteriota bacterium]
MSDDKRVALVTGGARGIGKAIAERLVSDGVDVAVADVNLEAATETAKELAMAGVKTLPLKANVADFKEAEAMVEAVVSELGAVHILINNAGITRDGLLLRMKEEDWDAVLDVNLKGVFNCTKAAVKRMSKQRMGRIVSIASIVGLMGNAGQANYAASKAGLIGFTKTVAREFAARGITANAVAPGFIETAMTEALSEKVREELAGQIPMGRLGTIADVAEAVAFLASDRASYITGQVISVNGGMYM